MNEKERNRKAGGYGCFGILVAAFIGAGLGYIWQPLAWLWIPLAVVFVLVGFRAAQNAT